MRAVRNYYEKYSEMSIKRRLCIKQKYYDSIRKEKRRKIRNHHENVDSKKRKDESIKNNKIQVRMNMIQ